MSQPVPLRVVSVTRETPEAVSIQLEPPADFRSQFLQFKPGQYLTFEVEIPGQGKVRRAYSICSVPGNGNTLTIAVKKVANGTVSVFMNEKVKAGDTLMAFKPEGRFTPLLHHERAVQYFLIAGGSGITPLMSILKAVLSYEPKSQVVLLYANRTRESVIFASELEKLARQHPDRFTYVQALDKAGLFWRGMRGPLNAADFKKFYLSQARSGFEKEIYICGPSGMMQEAVAGCVAAGVDKSKIFLEYFTSPAQESSTEKQSPTQHPVAAPVDAEAVIVLHKKEYNVPVPRGTTVLKAALDYGLDPPYSCEAGVCSTCMARLMEGKVKMVENNILTEKEVQEGYILTCQALCLTPKVVIQYLD